MIIKYTKFIVPKRFNAPETSLSIRLVYQSTHALNHLPNLWILPGGPGSNHSFYTLYDCLADKANLIYYDPRGCGLSEQSDPSTYTMDHYIDDIHIIKQALNQSNRMILLGKSYGAMCALSYALRYPDDLSNLILAAGVPTYEFIQTAQANLLARGTPEQKQMGELLWSGNIQSDDQMNQYFKIMASMYSWKTRHQESVSKPSPTQRFSFEALNAGFKNKFGQFDHRKTLKTIDTPTLILVGEEDWITDPIYSKEMAEKIPKAQFHCFEHADHAMELDVPDLFFSTIRDFI